MKTVWSCLCGVLLLGGTAFGSDWVSWRGPFDSGLAPESAVVHTWDIGGENVLWRLPFGGRSTPVIHDGRVFFNAPVGEGEMRRERVVCVDESTGKVIWENAFNVFHTDIVENRVAWTAVAVDPQSGNVYCHGTGGQLLCWNRDGKLLWERSLTEEFGRISGYGGRLMTPIVDEDRVVVSYLSSSWGKNAKGAHRYFAFDKNTGAVRWISAMPGRPLDTTYATPTVGVVAGRRLLIAPAADGHVYGMLARTGEIVWSYQLSKRGLNVSAVLDGNRVYVAHSEENYNTTEMGAVLCIDASLTGDITGHGALWRVDGLNVGYASPALANDRLYVVTNDADLFAMDAKDGRVIWEQNIGRVGKGSPTVTADGYIYIGEQNGLFHILQDKGDACAVLKSHKFERADGLVDEIFGSPAVVNGRVFLLTRYNTLCLGSREPAPRLEISRRPPAAEQTGGATASLLLTPAEITLAPGESVDLQVLGFNSHGAPTGTMTEQAAFVAEGVKGTLNGGTFTADSAGVYSAGTVTAEIGGQSAEARIRVIPPLPITLDFDGLPEGALPAGWNGVGLRVRVEAFEGERVLRKVTDKARPQPPFMRLRGYGTMPIAGGYTTEVEMRSGKSGNQWVSYKPDMGLINSRYRFIMLGADKALRIESWSPIPRLQKDVPFEYEPDTWYHAKFEVRPDGDAALCRAKVWKRGTDEPTDWSISVRDPSPNREGSAGLYCYSAGTTATQDGPVTYFDNFKVYKDE